MMHFTVLNKNESEKHGDENSWIINYLYRNPHKPILYDLENYIKLGFDDHSFILMLKDAARVERLLRNCPSERGTRSR